MLNEIILASKSEVRKQILLKHGINCQVEPSNVDEEPVKQSLIKICLLTSLFEASIISFSIINFVNFYY